MSTTARLHIADHGMPVMAQANKVKLSVGGTDHLARLFDDNGGVLVEIAHDGTLTYGEGYTPDDAARRFWDALAAARQA